MRAVRAVQAERARIRIGDSTEGRAGLEPVSQQIGAGKGEKAQGRSPRQSPAGEEGEKPGRERGRLAGEVHELGRARHAAEEEPSPPWPTAQKGEGEPRGPRGPQRHRCRLRQA